jgi:acetyl-CoA carboxylase biotin carboxyl carrier protein
MAENQPVVDQNLIRQLAELLNETGLTEIEVEQNNMRVRIARNLTITAAAPAAAAAPSPPPQAAEERPAASRAGTVTSPMVGTAYRAAEPGGRPFVEVGDMVKEGQTVMIIEAMKTMNQIPTPRAGTVKEILVDDAQPVEFGEPLMIIE